MIYERTRDFCLKRLLQSMLREGRSPRRARGYCEWISTCLMRCYKHSRDLQAVDLLFKLNRTRFLGAIRTRIRQSHLDANDVMQEVFLNILRYPARFRPESAESFRNWGYRIVRNTTSKLIKKERPIGSL